MQTTSNLFFSVFFCLTLILLSGCGSIQSDIQWYRDQAKLSQCFDNAQQITSAFRAYNDRHGAFPPLHTVDEEGKPLHSWRVLILPFIDQKILYDQIRLDEPWDSDHNRRFHNQMPSLYKCPGNPGDGCTYSVVAGWSFFPAKEPESILGLNKEDVADRQNISRAPRANWGLVETKETFNWMDPTADVTLEDIAGKRVGSYHHRNSNFIKINLLGGSGTISQVDAKQLAERILTDQKVAEKAK
jgi:hypothetical protein